MPDDAPLFLQDPAFYEEVGQIGITAMRLGTCALLVHHGYFWRGEDPRVVGMKRRRLATLLGNELSLIAYHLPLDAHPAVGNNAELGRHLGIVDVEPLHRDATG